MKIFSITLIILFLTVIGCRQEKRANEKNQQAFFIENNLSFFDPYEANYANGKYQGYIYKTWLRQPENLRMLHETFKKVGYHNLVSDYDLESNPCLLWGYVKRPLNHIIDSLIITYPLDSIETKYYREFWQRRMKEGNAQIVYEILLELDTILIKRRKVEYNVSLVNDTLYNLVLIDRMRNNPSRQQAQQDFEYLKSIGMHGSAYNLLFENYSYQNVDWDRDSLVEELRKDTLRCCPLTWIMDTTK
jgi:hypothetical protein